MLTGEQAEQGSGGGGEERSHQRGVPCGRGGPSFCTRSRTRGQGLHQVLLWLAVLGLVTMNRSAWRGGAAAAAGEIAEGAE